MMSDEARQPGVSWWRILEPFVALAVLIIALVYAVHRYEKRQDNTIAPPTPSLTASGGFSYPASLIKE